MSQINSDATDKSYWRSFGELEKSPGFQEYVDREFPKDASILEDGVTRRTFIKIMGASFAFAGLAGCSGIRRPKQLIRPYARTPENLVPGKSNYYATSMALGADVVGLLVESHEGRPTKIEGNPSHPMSLGAANAHHQASVLELYDPDRLKAPKSNIPAMESDLFASWMTDRMTDATDNGGQGIALLVETQPSPTFHRLLASFKTTFPKSEIYHYDAISNENEVAGIRSISGKSLRPLYHFDQIDRVVSFASDFLGTESANVANAKAFSSRRDPENERGMNRLYVLESNFSITGGKADHRIRIQPGQLDSAISEVADAVFNRLGRAPIAIPKFSKSLPEKELAAIVEDLTASDLVSAVVVGSHASPFAHAVAYALNAALGAAGAGISYYADSFAELAYVQHGSVASLKALTESIRSGATTSLYILGGNPAFTAPGDIKFADALKKLSHSLHLTLFHNETSERTQWMIPRAHYLESWGDLRALDTTVSVVQPLIEPLYNGVSDIEFLAQFISGTPGKGYDEVRTTLKSNADGGFEKSWRRWLHEGVVSTGTATPPSAPGRLSLEPTVNDVKGIQVEFGPDFKTFDGRFANSGWLQELPHPITKLTWDNAALISPATAQTLGLNTGDMVKIKTKSADVDAAIMIQPGNADNTVSISLGYGRKVAGRVGKGTGFNAFPLRTSSALAVVAGASIEKLGRTYTLATTQEHGSLEGRPIYKEAGLKEYEAHPEFAKEDVEGPPMVSSWPERKYDTGNQWGMAIDLSKCTGCNACLIACQSENNIPVVGKDQVANGREMHWIRLDRYFEGDSANPTMVQQPMTCLQCENAPCEQVCPVAATTHSTEGLNDMTYNRCIGTKYCSNNCPVKVRRFNFFDFHQRNPQSVVKDRVHFFDYMREPDKTVQMQFNPNVTVRMRGVMEKCTYCVQRIQEVKIRSKNENRVIADGEVKSACMQTCPSDAIVFGNILDPKSKVAKLKKNPRDYTILNELHLKARTSYLAGVRNPHPKLVREERA
jgi:molybdopterin-containing oxidoreductase family iron-sulfur binding subunit